MSGLDAAVEVFIDRLARDLAERVDAHLDRVLAQRDHQASGMTVTEVARRLDTSPRNVRRMVADGRLASVKMGRGRRIPNSALVALLEGSDQIEKTTPASKMASPAGVASIRQVGRGSS